MRGERRGGRGGVAGEGRGVLGGLRGLEPRHEALQAAPGRLGLARAELGDVDARRAELRARLELGSSIAAHRLSAVWREPTSTARAGASPSRAYGRKRSGCGLTVYSSAEPWTLTAYGTPSSARASTTGPITRWLASATSGRTRSATSRTAATLRSR